MELKMQPYHIPEAVTFNYDELKTALLEKAKMYESIIYSDEQIKFAKEDRAGLNRLKKAMNDERIRMEREYMQPLAQFKAQIGEIISIIDKPVQAIDRQVKDYEERQKAEKLEKIKAYWQNVLADDRVPDGICFDRVFNDRWLNASVTMKSIQSDIDGKLAQIEKDIAVIDSLPSYAFEAKQEYISSLDLAKAVSEAHRLEDMAKRRAAYEAEQEKRRAEQAATALESRTVEPDEELPTEPKQEIVREWVSFSAYLTPDEAVALGKYLRSHNIEFKAI